MTRPSGKRRGDRRFGQRVGREQVGKALDPRSPRSAAVGDFARARRIGRRPPRSSQRERQRRGGRSGATAGKRSNKAWSKRPALGGGAHVRATAAAAHRDPRRSTTARAGAAGVPRRRLLRAPSREAMRLEAAAPGAQRGGCCVGPCPASAGPRPTDLDDRRPRRARSAPSRCGCASCSLDDLAARLDAGDDQPLGGAGQADVEQAPMLLAGRRAFGPRSSAA